MPGHLLVVLDPSVVLQINRDAGCLPGVTSDRGEKTRSPGPLPDSRPGVVPVKSSSGHRRSNRINALEQGLPALEACGRDVLLARLLALMMPAHFFLLATFFLPSHLPTRPPV